jgi:hypothetical protein
MKDNSQARHQIWEAMQNGEAHAIGGLHENDLEWILKEALKEHSLIKLEISKELDMNHIHVKLEKLVK